MAVRMFILVCLVSILVLRVHSQVATVDLRCKPEVCAEWLSKNSCPPLDEECLEVGRIFTYPVECGCCSYCIKYLEENDWCDIGIPGQPTPSSICGAGLGCMMVEGFEHALCRPLNTMCHQKQKDYDDAKENGTLGYLQQRPACGEYGEFAAAICIPGSICYCVDPEGNRIFGERTFDSPDLQRTMTCECSRAAWRMDQLRLGADAVFSHCLPDGSFDPLQCVDSKCTCVDEEGALTSEDRVHVALLGPNSPPCFSEKLGHVASRWQRSCEAERSDLLARQREVARTNATFVSDLPICGHDGRYERKQFRDEMVICTDPVGNMIDNFKMNRYSLDGRHTDCNCARTQDTLRRAAMGSGLSPALPDCCPSGTFRPWQCSRGFCYCVDQNGNQVAQEVPEREKSELSCYNPDDSTGCVLPTSTS